MPTVAGPQVRLVPPDKPGATLYNCYQYITQLASLYSLQPGSGSQAQEQWTHSALDDVGHLYVIWDTAGKKAQGGQPVVLPVATAERVFRSCLRADLVARRMNVWTPQLRWLRLLSLVEKRWQLFLHILGAAQLALPDLLATLNANSRKRLGEVHAARVQLQAEEQRVTACFTLVAQGQ